MAVGGVNSSVRKPGVPGGSYVEVEGESIEIIQKAEQDPWWSPGDGVETGDAGSHGSAGGGGVSAPSAEPPVEAPTEPPPVEVATKPEKTGVDPGELNDTVKKKGYPKDFADRVSHNPKLKHYGETGKDEKGKLVTQLGNEALKSPEVLKSTLDHEFKHFEQARNGNYTNGKNPAAESVNDIEAYRSELANAKANGLPQEHIDHINKQIGLEMQFLQRLDPAYYDQVRDGNYQLRPEDRQQISD